MIKAVDIGLNGQKSLTADVQTMIDKADFLIGGDRHLSYLPARSLIYGKCRDKC